MKLVRRGTFETNSSSTHSITMCTESEFDKWKNGELFYCEEDSKFYDKEGRNKLIKEQIIINKAKYSDGNYTYNGITTTHKEIEKLFTEENLAEITEDEIESYIEDGDYDSYEIPLSYDEWDSYFDYEKYDEKYTTKNGETIVAFGYYGMDC